VDGREAEDRLYGALARTVKAVASPKRIELLEVLARANGRANPWLAQPAWASPTPRPTSKSSAGLASSTAARWGLRSSTGCRPPTSPSSSVPFVDQALSRLAEVDPLMRDHFAARHGQESVGRDQSVERAGKGDIAVLDVRPVVSRQPRSRHAIRPSGSAGRRPGPAVQGVGEIVALCQGPYCVSAHRAVQRLRAEGYTARRSRTDSRSSALQGSWWQPERSDAT